MPPALVEEALEHDRRLRRQRAERSARDGEIVDQLRGRVRRDAGIVGKLRDGQRPVARLVDTRDHLVAQSRHGVRQLVGAAGRLAEPERNRRRLPVRILDPHAAGFDAA